MTKKCTKCKRSYGARFIMVNGKKNEFGHWYTCSCGSTLLMPIQVLDYSVFNKVTTNSEKEVVWEG